MARLWLTRDGILNRSSNELLESLDYNFSRKEPFPKSSTDQVYWPTYDLSACSEMFEEVTGLKLKPGEGPKEVDLTIKWRRKPRVKRKRS